MKQEEFESWWTERQNCCSASNCVLEAYSLIKDLLASSREHMAELLERAGHGQAAALVRMTTVDGFGDPELDFWPQERQESPEGGAGGGGLVLLISEVPATLTVTARFGGTLEKTTHRYPGLEAWKKDRSMPFPVGACENGCGCEMSAASGTAAPAGVDPFGECPKK